MRYFECGLNTFHLITVERKQKEQKRERERFILISTAHTFSTLHTQILPPPLQCPFNFSNFEKFVRGLIPRSKSGHEIFSTDQRLHPAQPFLRRLPLRARIAATSSRALGWVTKRIIGTVADRTNSNFLAAWSDLYIINPSPIYHRPRDNYSKVYPSSQPTRLRPTI